MAFEDIPLPVEIEQGAQGGPAFKTSVITLSSGHEQRNEEWSNTRASWNVSIGIERKADFVSIVKHFMARRGMSATWPFKDWTDYEITEAIIGEGDGVETDFQCVKTYADAVATFTRTITRPIVATAVISVDGTPLLSSDWTYVGLGVFRLDTAPAVGKDVTITCQFNNCVRYDVDQLRLAVIWEGAASVPEINIIEVREP